MQVSLFGADAKGVNETETVSGGRQGENLTAGFLSDISAQEIV